MPMTILDAAMHYIRRGWNPVPIEYRSKKPIGEAWQNRIIDETNATRFFNGERMNIGVQLGANSHGLCDVDLDCPEAIAVAPYVLPKTRAVFGHASRRYSHFLYHSDLALTEEVGDIKFKDPTKKANDDQNEKSVLVELRIGGGERGAQTVFPPSTHKETGEPIAWEENGEPADVDGADLRRRVGAVAAYSLLARHWPRTGSRHDAALVVGGFLARANRSKEAIKVAAEAIARAARDEEWRDRVKAAQDAAAAYHDGGHAFGLNGLRETFGAEVATKCAEWLGYDGSGEPQPEPQADEQQEPAKPLMQSSAQFIKDFVPPDYLIDGLLQRRFCYSFTARTGGGKTAIVLLFAALVGLEQRLGTREVAKGRTLILAGENPDDVRMRWIAMAQHMGFDPETIDVHFIPGTLKLSQAMARIRKEAEAIGDLTLVIVDTSAAYFEGEDENSNVQLGTHARRLRKLVELPGGPCVIINCHPTKNAADDNLLPRGGGAFVAEMDGNLTAIRTDMAIEMHWQGKFRGPDFPPVSFLLKSVTHQDLKDSKGNLIPTVVAKHLSETEQEDLTNVSRAEENQLLKAIIEKPGASQAELAKALGWYLKTGDPHKSKVRRALIRLKKFKLVTADRDGFTLTEKGRKSLQK
jgi:AAA domain/Bifunctional DNA primase/polymerase, N-terminal